MKNGWITKKLEDLFEIGSSKRVHKSDWKSSGIPFYRAREIVKLADTGYVENELFISEKLYDDFKKQYGVPSCGDLMVTGVGTIGRCYRVKEDDEFYFKDASVLWFKAKGEVDTRFIQYALMSPEVLKQIFDYSGATVLTLTISRSNDITIPIPPLSEQQRIVAILDQAFEGIATAKANAEKNLQNARELFESHLNAVFTQRGEEWEEKPLGKCAKSISTGPFGSMLHKSDYTPDGFPLVNPINIVNGEIVPDGKKNVNEATRRRLSSYILNTGDLVVARRGEIGRCAVVSPDQDGWLCGTGCFFIRLADGILPEFVARLIQSYDYREQLENLATGATMKNLSNSTLQNFVVHIPSKKQQETIIAQLQSLASSCTDLELVYRQKLTTLDELKQSLLHKAFAGEL